jgi:hypothetical protein
MRLLSLYKSPNIQNAGWAIPRKLLGQLRVASSPAKSSAESQSKDAEVTKMKETRDKPKKTAKSMADLDEEMKQAMENLSGDGGEYGMELEGGKPVAMKRAVKENMFRYI